MQKIKLFKYISFDQYEHWKQPLVDGTLYFSTIKELREVNDVGEFRVDWDIDSTFFKDLGRQLPRFHNELFDKARVLCLCEDSRVRSSMWERFCPGGGVCYEFLFTKSDSKDVTHKRVTYSDNKFFSAAKYFLNSIEGGKLRDLLLKKGEHNRTEKIVLLAWLNSGVPSNILVDHIETEVAFKKSTEFKDEMEYRFIHLSGTIGSKKLLLNLENNKTKFSEFGLTLKAVYSSDVERVRQFNKSDCTPILSHLT